MSYHDFEWLYRPIDFARTARARDKGFRLDRRRPCVDHCVLLHAWLRCERAGADLCLERPRAVPHFGAHAIIRHRRPSG